MLSVWLDPLRAIDPDGEPVAEVLGYVRRKLQLARDFPRESRLFANEILQGAPRIADVIAGDLKALVDDKAALLSHWMKMGKLNPVAPVHLIFSIWSLTQHYADFDVQVRLVLGKDHDPFAEAEGFLETLFTKLLQPVSG
jgi:TetR/AcrR family transcriptional regulator